MAPNSSTLGLRELKKRQTRFELSAAARRLVLSDGLDAVTVEDIARAAGVSPRTFFNYYETKMDALIGPFESEPGTPESRAVFAAGGPTGVLLDDVVDLFEPTEPDHEMREHIAQIAILCGMDTRVLAAFVASGTKHQAAVGELLSRRLGERASQRYVALAAALVTTIMARAALAWAGDSAGPLREAFREHCVMAAQLFDAAPQDIEEGAGG